MTPPDNEVSNPKLEQGVEEVRSSLWTVTSTPRHTQRIDPFHVALHGLDSNTKQPTRRGRSLSHSTIDAKSIRQGIEAGAFKVVIDRAELVSKPLRDQRISLPILQVPIPHYRLGTPRFSARGTAFIQSSVYARSSANEDIPSSVFSGGEYDRLFPVPPHIDPISAPSRRHSYTSSQPCVHIDLTHEGNVRPIVAPSETHGLQKEPIRPAIFDSLAANPDNPCIVRYAPLSKEIVAATPARIIAQVTSENFLDYELLSDFFLTVRSYLSTHDLLSYLVARFEWAINRFDDNGRVIRVRAFAALRHWILNYFSYDFMLDRDLRVQFCNRLNDLTKIVRGRVNYGNSDMKLISDLKKCWNGRCSLYWDYPESTNETRQDIDIHPGGIPGSRDSQLVHPNQLDSKATSVEPLPSIQTVGHLGSTSDVESWNDEVAEAGEDFEQDHITRTSAFTTRSLPTSPISEQSIQALSCTIPTKSFKKIIPHGNRAMGSQVADSATEVHRGCPVAPSAMANERGMTSRSGHKRSGSFSDAARDKRTSLSSIRNETQEDQAEVYPFSGSLIRGNLVLPVPPYVRIFAPMTPSFELPKASSSSHENEDEVYDSRKLGVPSTPGVKTLLGSIRRALSRKYSGSSVSPNLIGGDVSAPSLSLAKSSALPLNMVYQAGSNSPAEGSRSNMRIDLLGADVAEAFRRAIGKDSKDEIAQFSQIGLALGNEREQPSPKIHEPTPEQPVAGANLRPTDFRRMHSEVTNGSKSILIMDDTGFRMPNIPAIMSGALGATEPHHQPHESFAMTRSVTPPISTDPSTQSFLLINESPAPRPLDQPHLLASLLKKDGPSGVLRTDSIMESQRVVSKVGTDRPRASAINRGHSFKSNKSGSTSLRRYASFQSTFAKTTQERDHETTAFRGSGRTTTEDLSDCPRSRMLRRRPGGDLRANQNVHDLEQLPRPRSAGSITTCTDSTRGSGLLMASTKITPTRIIPSSSPIRPLSSRLADPSSVTEKKSPSLVQTHSSQPALRRPSFEAAVAKFAQIPDDNEGGIEATLLKLEGKYQRSPIDSESLHHLPTSDETTTQPLENTYENRDTILERWRQRHENTRETNHGDMPISLLETSSSLGPSQSSHLGVGNIDLLSGAMTNVPSIRYTASEDSYRSTPLLERGPSHRSRQKNPNQDHQMPVIPQPLFARSQLLPADTLPENESIRRLRHGSYAPTVTTDSFLLDEDEFLSDLSSEMSEEGETGENVMSSGAMTATGGTQETMVLDLGYHPPSPPMTMENALSFASQANQTQEQRKPPTPDPSPVSQHVELNIARRLNTERRSSPDPPQTSLHMPFILGYDSELLAQQFTIVEKDALNEIDWRDLVGMRWNNSSPQVTNWVNYLRTNQPSGIDIVTARFNVVVKWALSEIVLTRNIEERALTIKQYIRVAQQARKIHNYATMLQLTIALTSIDCSRLTKTWDMVPLAEKNTLRELESLVTPIRNFNNLRVEMEKANADEGCIPVVGKNEALLCLELITDSTVIALYIHDLTYNSQKPPLITNSYGGEPLINFERHRTTAVLVKSLLQLIDASARYSYRPVEGIIERCLWMAALPDEMIRIHSKALE